MMIYINASIRCSETLVFATFDFSVFIKFVSSSIVSFLCRMLSYKKVCRASNCSCGKHNWNTDEETKEFCF